jgi:hypothetical protein
MTNNQNVSKANPSIKAFSKLSWLAPPPLLEGDDATFYDELLARISGDVKPNDIFEEFWMRDIVDLTWEVLRWRRIKLFLVREQMSRDLLGVLWQLRRQRPEETEDEIDILRSRLNKLVAKWARQDPAAIGQVNRRLAAAKLTMETVANQAFMKKFDTIERLDHFATILEGRRNAALRELDRHRVMFAQALRGSVQRLENSLTDVVEVQAAESAKNLDKNAA